MAGAGTALQAEGPVCNKMSVSDDELGELIKMAEGLGALFSNVPHRDVEHEHSLARSIRSR